MALLPKQRSDFFENAKQYVPWFWAIYLSAILVPIVAYLWNPLGEDPGEWLKRCGSIAVAIGFIAEYPAIAIHSTFQVAQGNKTYKPAKAKYRKYFHRMTSAVVALVCIGTLVSGFGDVVMSVLQAGRAEG